MLWLCIWPGCLLSGETSLLAINRSFVRSHCSSAQLGEDLLWPIGAGPTTFSRRDRRLAGRAISRSQLGVRMKLCYDIGSPEYR